VKTLALAALLAFSPLGAWAPAQDLGSPDAQPVKSRQYVVYAAEPQVVSAGKRGTLELHFQVQSGYHINSHTPKSELLIPTAVELAQAPGVKLATASYPAGSSYSFSFDPGTKLDVYVDGFTVKLPVIATPGTHELHGTLHYQACDHAACYPPRSLPIAVPFTAK
jgi:hypothetical protein